LAVEFSGGVGIRQVSDREAPFANVIFRDTRSPGKVPCPRIASDKNPGAIPYL
jgi:hypothetical protein